MPLRDAVSGRHGSADLLEALKTEVRHMLKARKGFDQAAEQRLRRTTEDHLRLLREGGVRDFDSRMQGLRLLNKETAGLLRRAMDLQVPGLIRQTAVEAIISRFGDFYRVLTTTETVAAE